MRIRYGKPVKVKSLLEQSNIPFSYTAANVTFYPLTTGTFYYYAGSGVSNIRYVNRQANHKYFLFLNTDTAYSWSYFGIWDTYSTGYDGNRAAPIKDGNNYYALISPITSVTNGVPTFQFGGTQNLPSIANYALIIDLTEIGLDNLTAQEFYNKYNKYFPLLAAGEEITIDDRAGQIAYKNLEEDSIRCKVAGGSSDIYYGYNQKITPYENTNHNGNAYSYDPDTNTFTLTANASTTTYYFGLSCTKLTGIAGHKVLFVGNVTEVSTAAPFSDITGEWAMINITDRQRATGVGLTYCIGEWRDVTSNYVNISTSTGFTVGDYFKIKDVQTIDLTEWFGAEKEPSTYEEFKEKFSKEYYGFCKTPIKLTRYQIEALPNYGYNQLVQPITYYTTSAGFSWAHDKGILTLSGSNITSTYVNPFYAQPIIAGHKYLAYANISSNSKSVSFQFGMLNDSVRINNIILGEHWTIMSAAANKTTSIGLAQFVSGSDIGVIVGHFLMIDLTDWYGEGEEPVTVEEFKATFPNKYYPYSQKRLLNKYMINKLQA